MPARWLHDPLVRDTIGQLVEHVLDSEECHAVNRLIDGMSGRAPLSPDEARNALQRVLAFSVEATLIYATVTDYLQRAAVADLSIPGVAAAEMLMRERTPGI